MTDEHRYRPVVQRRGRGFGNDPCPAARRAYANRSGVLQNVLRTLQPRDAAPQEMYQRVPLDPRLTEVPVEVDRCVEMWSRVAPLGRTVLQIMEERIGAPGSDIRIARRIPVGVEEYGLLQVLVVELAAHIVKQRLGASTLSAGV